MSKPLTKNQILVLDTLKAAPKPQTAYSLLEQLKEHGLKAPPQIYRALEKLLTLGLIHKLESINSFVACQHSDCGHQIAGFAICDGVIKFLKLSMIIWSHKSVQWPRQRAWYPKKSTMEIHGLCRSCKGNERGLNQKF